MSALDLSPGEMYLGNPTRVGERDSEPVVLPVDDLTTHGLIVGMTGSGKTGLGVILVEEALLAGVPCLVIDPKGDMASLALRFPQLAADDFEPWIDAVEAHRSGQSTEQAARATAERWRDGLERSGIGTDRLERLAATSQVTLFTPGSTTGVPINVLGSLRPPEGLTWETDTELLRDQIQVFVTGLLDLAGLPADPIASREHILLASIIEHDWRHDEPIDLARLLGRITQPPFRKLGVFELDSFFPPPERRELAMRLNSLVASPAFRPWLEGAALDIASLLRTADGRPRAAVMTLAHLSEVERHFAVALLLSRLIGWMRSQPGTSSLRCLVYIDEMFGFAPPTANPPPKGPILTLAKQGRASGVGIVLATQNPMDLDYKAFANTGTWMIGRLQTQRDKARVLEGLKSARGDVDIDAADAVISSLDKREFYLHSVHRGAGSATFSTRWAMAYLRGPLTSDEISRLVRESGAGPELMPSPVSGDHTAPTASAPGGHGAASESVPPPSQSAADTTPIAPLVSSQIGVSYVSSSAPWLSAVGASPAAKRLEPGLAVTVRLRYDDRASGVDHAEVWEAIYHPLEHTFDPRAAIAVDHDPRDFLGAPPDGASYVIADAPLDSAAYFRSAESAIKKALHADRAIEVFRNADLGLYGRVGESEADFKVRAQMAAEAEEDREAASLRDKHASKLKSLHDKIATARQRRENLEVDVQERRREEVVSGAGALLQALFGGRASARSIATRAARAVSAASSRRSRSARTAERLAGAEERVEDLVTDVQDLEATVLEELAEIDAKWRRIAESHDTVSIGLEKSDVHVEDMRLVWIPFEPNSAAGRAASVGRVE